MWMTFWISVQQYFKKCDYYIICSILQCVVSYNTQCVLRGWCNQHTNSGTVFVKFNLSPMMSTYKYLVFNLSSTYKNSWHNPSHSSTHSSKAGKWHSRKQNRKPLTILVDICWKRALCLTQSKCSEDVSAQSVWLGSTGGNGSDNVHAQVRSLLSSTCQFWHTLTLCIRFSGTRPRNSQNMYVRYASSSRYKVHMYIPRFFSWWLTTTLQSTAVAIAVIAAIAGIRQLAQPNDAHW